MQKELPPHIPREFATAQTRHILDSYKKWTGKNLIDPLNDSYLQACRLFWAPFVVVTSTNDPDPILNYGNQTALNLWEMSWQTLTQTPGRKTAEPIHRDERQKFLDTVKKNGFIDHYSGIRISSTGKRFKIEQATVWNLVDCAGKILGQAATFKNWTHLP